MSLWRSVDDFSDAAVDAILDRADAYASGTAEPLGRPGPVVGLLFLETSLRTRVGFAAAAARLGGQAILVDERRHSPFAMPESLADTLRTLMGYTDVVVARTDVELDPCTVPEQPPTPVVSGGDRGLRAEHPTQALIDLFTIRREFGGTAGLTVAICGDLRMRAVVSLLKMLARRPPRRLVVVSHEAFDTGDAVLAGASVEVEHRPPTELSDVDLLYVAGMPHASAGEDVRCALRVTADVLRGMPAGAVVTSPLPLIDEVDREARADTRFRAFVHSDAAVHVRMAVLEHVLLNSSPPLS